jgi:hypothetical protein
MSKFPSPKGRIPQVLYYSIFAQSQWKARSYPIDDK